VVRNQRLYPLSHLIAMQAPKNIMKIFVFDEEIGQKNQ
jgi:hypothetical protein